MDHEANYEVRNSEFDGGWLDEDQDIRHQKTGSGLMKIKTFGTRRAATSLYT